MLPSIYLDLNVHGDQTFILPWLDTWYPFAERIIIPDIETKDDSRRLIDNFHDVRGTIELVGDRYDPLLDGRLDWLLTLKPYQFMLDTSIEHLVSALEKSPGPSRVCCRVNEFYFDLRHCRIISREIGLHVRRYAEGNRGSVFFSGTLFSYYLIGSERVKILLTHYPTYYNSVWKRWENTRSIDEALKGNMGFPSPWARGDSLERHKLVEFNRGHPEEIEKRIRYFKDERKDDEVWDSTQRKPF